MSKNLLELQFGVPDVQTSNIVSCEKKISALNHFSDRLGVIHWVLLGWETIQGVSELHVPWGETFEQQILRELSL